MRNARDFNVVTSFSNGMAESKSDEVRIARLRQRAEETEKMVSQLRRCVEALKQKAGKETMHSLKHAPQQFIILLCSGNQQRAS